jgi:hypothetical protein
MMAASWQHHHHQAIPLRRDTLPLVVSGRRTPVPMPLESTKSRPMVVSAALLP